jgi:hypothetical protein
MCLIDFPQRRFGRYRISSWRTHCFSRSKTPKSPPSATSRAQVRCICLLCVNLFLVFSLALACVYDHVDLVLCACRLVIWSRVLLCATEKKVVPQYCGILEFSAEGDMCYMPTWMMQNIALKVRRFLPRQLPIHIITPTFNTTFILTLSLARHLPHTLCFCLFVCVCHARVCVSISLSLSLSLSFCLDVTLSFCLFFSLLHCDCFRTATKWRSHRLPTCRKDRSSPCNPTPSRLSKPWKKWAQGISWNRLCEVCARVLRDTCASESHWALSAISLCSCRHFFSPHLVFPPPILHYIYNTNSFHVHFYH